MTVVTFLFPYNTLFSAYGVCVCSCKLALTCDFSQTLHVIMHTTLCMTVFPFWGYFLLENLCGLCRPGVSVFPLCHFLSVYFCDSLPTERCYPRLCLLASLALYPPPPRAIPAPFPCPVNTYLDVSPHGNCVETCGDRNIPPPPPHNAEIVPGCSTTQRLCRDLWRPCPPPLPPAPQR